MTESDEIEEILYEAHDLGMKDLVMEKAKEILSTKNNMLSKSNAYRQAFHYARQNPPAQIGSNGIVGETKQSEK